MKRLLLCVAATTALLAAPLPAHAAHAAHVTDTPVTATSFNDAVHAVAQHGSTVYAGGDFGFAFDRGRRFVRSHLAATTSTGALTSFAPQLNGSVESLATNGRHLYVGGRFTRVDGVAMQRIARFSLDTGQLDTDFKVRVSALPRALAVSDDRLYIGGNFNAVNGQTRTKVAAVDLTDGRLITDFAPVVDRGVRGMTLAGGRLYIGGGFTEINGTAVRKLAALDAADGDLIESFAPTTNGVVYDVAVSGGRVYAAAGGPGGRVHSFDTSGVEHWHRTTDGDAVAVTVHDGVVYVGGHFEKVCAGPETGDSGCVDGEQADRGKLFAVTTGNTLLDWNPDADSVLGVLTLEAAGSTLAAGGTFLTFGQGTVKQRALALFRS